MFYDLFFYLSAAYIRHFPLHFGKGRIVRFAQKLDAFKKYQRLMLSSGHVICIDPNGAIACDNWLFGGFENVEQDKARDLMKPESVVFDVGANCGVFTRLLADEVIDGHIYAFEPSKRARQLLECNIEDVRSVCTVVPVAISDVKGSVFIDDPEDTALTSVSNSRNSGHADEVDATTLDDYWVKLGKPDVQFVKIDIEGGEMECVLGAKAILLEKKPSLLIEIHGQESIDAMTTLLSDLGYSKNKVPGFKPWNHFYSVV